MVVPLRRPPRPREQVRPLPLWKPPPEAEAAQDQGHLRMSAPVTANSSSRDNACLMRTAPRDAVTAPRALVPPEPSQRRMARRAAALRARERVPLLALLALRLAVRRLRLRLRLKQLRPQVQVQVLLLVLALLVLLAHRMLAKGMGSNSSRASVSRTQTVLLGAVPDPREFVRPRRLLMRVGKLDADLRRHDFVISLGTGMVTTHIDCLGVTTFCTKLDNTIKACHYSSYRSTFIRVREMSP